MAKRLFYLVTLLTLISAATSGIVGMLEPSQLGLVSIEELPNGPFTDFFILATILTILGLLNAVVLMMVHLKTRYIAQASIIIGAFQVGLVIVQVYILAGINLLDVVYLLLGMFQMLYGIKVFHTQRLRAWWKKAAE